MHPYRALALLPALAMLALAGCTEAVPPLIEEPLPMSLPSAPGSIGPRLSRGHGETVLLSWMERAETGATLRVAELGDDRWLAARDVVGDPNMFVNWADLPSVTAMGEDHWVAHGLTYSANLTYSYDISLIQSQDAGHSWSAPIIPHDDGTPTEHGFVSMWPGDTVGIDAIGMIWLDGRHMGSEADSGDGGMTLRAAFVDEANKLSGEQEIDGLVCDCCQTDVAVSSGGPIAVYRDRTPEEIRDISLSRYLDGHWQAGEAFSNDGWEINACPVNGPAIAAADELVAVAWFTAAGGNPRVQIRVSKNGGQQFGEAVLVAEKDVLGHVDIAYIGDASFAVSWLANSGELNDVLVRSVTATGALGNVKNVARTAVGRTVPQMVEHRRRLIFAWSDTRDGQSHLASVSAGIVFAEQRKVSPLKLWW